jgi:hypothetical protein
MKKEGIKKFWDWIWNSDSFWSYVVFFILVFIVIKYIFFPLLGIALGSQLPLAIVESSSMDHHFIKYCVSTNEVGVCQEYSTDYELCGKKVGEKISMDLNGYWVNCGSWYRENTDIDKEQFSDFAFKNGFSKGDILILWGWKEPEIGDVLLFKANKESLAPRPIIHRVTSLDPLQTKGDHNEGQLTKDNNIYKTDETTINEEQVIGIAVARIPWIGWVKLGVVELFNKLR